MSPIPAAPTPKDLAEASRGVFIAFEGGDGAGKSTQVDALAARLRDAGRRVVVTREPGGTPFGERLRALLLDPQARPSPRAEALLFAADRAHHVDALVRPALASGAVVLTDRFMDSSIAYQGAGRELSAGEMRGLSVWATGGMLPDLTVLLDVAPEVGRQRRSGADDRMEAEPDDFHARVRAGFLRLAQAEPHRYLVVDAAEPMPSVAAAVWARVQGVIAGGAR